MVSLGINLQTVKSVKPVKINVLLSREKREERKEGRKKRKRKTKAVSYVFSGGNHHEGEVQDSNSGAWVRTPFWGLHPVPVFVPHSVRLPV